MSKSKINRTIGLTAVFMFLLQILLAIIYYQDINRNMEQQLKSRVKNECNDAKSNLESRISAKMEWLQMVADVASLTEVATGETQENWWTLIQQHDKESEYRVGIADNKGTLYFGTHKKKEISDRAAYQKLMRGESAISPVIKGTFEGKDSIVLGAPILSEDGETLGAIKIEYAVMGLGKLLNPSDLEGRGCNLVIDSDGNLVASLPGMEKYETVYDMLSDRVMEDDSCISTMKDNVKAGKAGFLGYSKGKDNRVMYYQPAGIQDWTVLSIVSVDAYSDLISKAKTRTTWFMILSLLLTGGGILIIAKLFREKKIELERASIDTLTGVYTRAQGRLLVDQRFESNNLKCFGCLFMDLDHFKTFNDKYGHEAGDQVLAFVGNVIRTSLRVHDIAYRFGGDEFCIWLCGTGSRKEIELVAKRIMEGVGKGDDRIHFSIGATVVSETEKDKDIILKRADEALYEAKKAGRNRVMFDS